ncbi:MAG: hypothetical protein AAGM22_05180 [Acidobacteriota bacterium]
MSQRLTDEENAQFSGPKKLGGALLWRGQAPPLPRSRLKLRLDSPVDAKHRFGVIKHNPA